MNPKPKNTMDELTEAVIAHESQQTERVMKYDVIFGAMGLSAFIVEVNRYVAEGWKPVGGVAMSETEEDMHFAQAIVLEVNSKEH